MRLLSLFTLFIISLSVRQTAAQPSLKGDSLIQHIQLLAQDELKGRFPGTQGDTLAAHYIISQFEKAGLTPLFNYFRQRFSLTTLLEAAPSANYIKLLNNESLALNKGYSIYPFSAGINHSARLIFHPNLETAWQLVAQHKGAWLLLEKQKAGAASIDSLSEYQLAQKAAEAGAGGILFYNPVNIDSNDVLVRTRPRKEKILPLPVLQLKRDMAQIIKQYYLSDSTFVSQEELTAFVNILPVKAITNNIAGVIRGNDPLLKNEYIIIGAHYDHLGTGGYGTGSLAPTATDIHNGADDNASGTAALIGITQALQANKELLKRSIIVVAFSGEEEGLLGSQYFVQNLPVPKSAVKLMLNMDMVGRLNEEQHLYMGGAGTFPGGVELMKTLGKKSPLNLVIHAGGVGGSDHVSFYNHQISCIGFHTGGHPQYHTPDDDTVHINIDGIEKVAQYIYQAVLLLANSERGYNFIPQD